MNKKKNDDEKLGQNLIQEKRKKRNKQKNIGKRKEIKRDQNLLIKKFTIIEIVSSEVEFIKPLRGIYFTSSSSSSSRSTSPNPSQIQLEDNCATWQHSAIDNNSKSARMDNGQMIDEDKMGG